MVTTVSHKPQSLALSFLFLAIVAASCSADPAALPAAKTKEEFVETFTARDGTTLLLRSEQETDAKKRFSGSEQVLRAQLSDNQFAIACENGTEPPFRNAYWNNKAEGLYVDMIDGTALFLSSNKFDSGTGWPSFYQALDVAVLDFIVDDSYGMRRIEVRAKASKAHLGHVFEDGPPPSGLRYCINSASLRFIPKAELSAQGYENWLAKL